MSEFKISNDEVIRDIIGGVLEFPKYTTQIINLANQNAQGTRPKVVGQMSELIKEFPDRTFDEWKVWYNDRMPDAVDEATEKTFTMVIKMKDAFDLINKQMVRDWVEDLVVTKTYTGLYFQEIILKRIANLKNTTYRLATPEEESKGIDGFIGDKPVSIKPSTYDTKKMLGETISAEIIYYDKMKDGIKVRYDF